jgi:TPR repeat protein
MYEDGSGVEIDYRQAANWYRASAEKGDGRGQFGLANLYMTGKGVPLDYVSAYVWYSAASSGDSLGARQLKSLRKLMTPRQLGEAQARLSARQEQGGASAKSVDAGHGVPQPFDSR